LSLCYGLDRPQQQFKTILLRLQPLEVVPGGCPISAIVDPDGSLASKGIQCQGYADDIVIIARGKFEQTLCDIIQL